MNEIYDTEPLCDKLDGLLVEHYFWDSISKEEGKCEIAAGCNLARTFP